MADEETTAAEVEQGRAAQVEVEEAITAEVEVEEVTTAEAEVVTTSPTDKWLGKPCWGEGGGVMNLPHCSPHAAAMGTRSSSDSFIPLRDNRCSRVISAMLRDVSRYWASGGGWLLVTWGRGSWLLKLIEEVATAWTSSRRPWDNKAERET